MGTTSTVTISAVTYPVYGTYDGAVAYLAVKLTDAGVAWRAATADTRKSAMVEAARLLDVVGLTDGATPPAEIDSSSSTVPDQVVQASYELAAAYVADPSIMEETSNGASNIKRVNAKGVEVEWFGPRTGGASGMPSIVDRLLQGYLLSQANANTSGAAGVHVGGTCERSEFDDCDRYDLR